MTRVAFLPPAPSRSGHPKRLCPLGRRLACLLVSVGAIAPLACDNPFNPGETHVVVGHVDFDGPFFHDTVEVADTVTANVPLEITFRTAGGGCHEGGHTEVRMAGAVSDRDPLRFAEGRPSRCLHGYTRELLAHGDRGLPRSRNRNSGASVQHRYGL